MELSTLPLTRKDFDTGFTWATYLSGMEEYGDTSRSLYERAAIAPDVAERFDRLVDRHGGKLSISAMTEAWCGDSAVVLPIVARLAAQLPRIELRVLVGSAYPALHAAYEEDGFKSIPLLSFFDASWHEVGRWMERPKSADVRVKSWVAARPRIAELYGSGEPEAKAELKSIFGGLVREMADWYRDGFWEDTLAEIEALLG